MESQFARSRVVRGRTGNTACVSWAQDHALRYNPHCLRGLWFLSCNWGTENNPLLVESPAWSTHIPPACLHMTQCLRKLGQKVACLSQKVELQKSSGFRDHLDNRAPGPPKPDGGERKDALNFFLLFPLHPTDTEGKPCRRWTQEQKTKHKVTPEQLSQTIHKTATAWRRSTGDWDPSCSFANKEYMKYHL